MDLRLVLKADALVCFAFGAVFLLLADPLVPLLLHNASRLGGLDATLAFRLLGIGVLAIGAGVALVARSTPIRTVTLAPILAIEVLWIGACIAILLGTGDCLTTLGVILVLASAAAVAGFLALEAAGLRSHLNQQP